MAGANKVRYSLVGVELETLSLVLHFWANPETVEKRKANWKDKLPKFRSAIIAGMGKGASERSLPRELLACEYKVVHDVVLSLKRRHKNKTNAANIVSFLHQEYIPYEGAKNERKYEFKRPVPIAKKYMKEFTMSLLGKGMSPSELARKITANRFGCSEKKVKEAVSSKAFKRVKLTREQGLLISVFLDLCSLPDKQIPIKLLKKVLYTLFFTECHLLVILYLLKNAHAINERMFLGDYDYQEVEKLCDFVVDDKKMIKEFQPFIRLQ